MKDKFRENFWIAFPAAVATLILILILSFQTEVQGQVSQSYHLVQVIPYVLVLIGGIIGINVFVVLLVGIVSGAFIMLAGGHIAPVDLLANMGTAGRCDGHCYGKQYSGDRHGKSDRKRNGTGVRHHAEKSSLDPGYLFLYFPGHHPIRCPDAGGDFCRK